MFKKRGCSIDFENSIKHNIKKTQNEKPSKQVPFEIVHTCTCINNKFNVYKTTEIICFKQFVHILRIRYFLVIIINTISSYKMFATFIRFDESLVELIDHGVAAVTSSHISVRNAGTTNKTIPRLSNKIPWNYKSLELYSSRYLCILTNFYFFLCCVNISSARLIQLFRYYPLKPSIFDKNKLFLLYNPCTGFWIFGLFNRLKTNKHFPNSHFRSLQTL